MGGLLGFVIAAAIILILFMLDTAIRDEHDLANAFDDITILGVIPVIQSTTKAQGNEQVNEKKNS